jgi:23S rRNA maturation-related 3'-5' exoribonuclease YhaM
MAIRIRKVSNVTVALCAAETDQKERDIYLDDTIHYALAAKFARDWQNQLVDWNYPDEWKVMDSQKLRDSKEEIEKWLKMTTLNYIKSQIENLSTPEFKQLCEIVVNDQDFINGYGAREHHHNYKGGLVVHTTEVLKNCLSVNLDYLNKDVLIISAIWHDYLKKKDYCLKVGDGEPPKIAATKYKEQIYHVAGSWAEFYHQAKKLNINEEFIEQIGHCLLSHHGRPEWGSAITPQTPEAVVLHWADCMSAWFENGKYKEK